MIRFVGLNKLAEEEQSKVKLIAERAFEKYSAKIKDPLFVLHVKLANKEGNRKEFNIKARLESPDGMFEASHFDYDLPKTLHKVMDHLENQLKHKLKD